MIAVIPLSDCALCADCDHVFSWTQKTCPLCGSKSWLALSRVLAPKFIEPIPARIA